MPNSKPYLSAKEPEFRRDHAGAKSPPRSYRRAASAARLAPSHFLETIADPVKSFDHIEVIIGRFEFLAQPFDVAIDGAVVDIDLIVISGIHEGIAAFHNAGTACQRLQDQKFRNSESHGLIFPSTGVAFLVHAQQAAFEDLGIHVLGSGAIFRRHAAQHSLHAFDEKTLRERLANEVVGPHFEAEQFIDLFVFGCEKYDRHVRLLPQAAQCFHAVHTRHLDVEDGEVGGRRLETIKRGSAVRIGHDAIALGLERNRNRGQNVTVVVNESNSWHISVRDSPKIFGRNPSAANPGTLMPRGLEARKRGPKCVYSSTNP